PVNVPPPPVNVPPPPVNVPAPPPVPTAVTAPVPTPNVGLPDPSLPNPAGAAQLPGGAGTPAAAGIGGTPALPSGLAPSSSLPPGVIGSGAAIDPSSGAAVTAAGGSTSLGERDYSSAGSPATLTAVDGAAAQRSAAQPGTPAQSAPMICPQLAFAPLVSGCESVLGPLNGPVGETLAHTGTPIAIGVAGLFLLGLGGVLYRRSSKREDSSAASPLRSVETR
ncbi:MAG: hypothetical protein M3Z97_14595, partial [Candidatus Dormibacteraeota bacterium]|nr:hypothetical protein [Candidatus Dormibacteraeota bacterium]